MSRFLDTYFTVRGSDSVAQICCACAAGCCICVAENAYATGSQGLSVSSFLKTISMLGAGAAGIYCAYLVTPFVYNGVVDSMREHSDAADWSIKMLAGITTAAVDTLVPLTAINLGGWSARAVGYGMGRLKTCFFTERASDQKQATQADATVNNDANDQRYQRMINQA